MQNNTNLLNYLNMIKSSGGDLLTANCVIQGSGETGSLFISNFSVALDEGELKSHKISAVLSAVASERPPTKLYSKLKIKQKVFTCQDFEKQDISQHFKPACEFIEEELAKGNVLVHCGAGVSRSSTIVISYLMWKNKIPFMEALKIMEKRHPPTRPNPGFQKQLIKYEKIILKA